jgi:hypothetical protein
MVVLCQASVKGSKISCKNCYKKIIRVYSVAVKII